MKQEHSSYAICSIAIRKIVVRRMHIWHWMTALLKEEDELERALRTIRRLREQGYMGQERSSFVEISGYLVQELKDLWTIDFYHPSDKEVHIVDLPKNAVTLEYFEWVGRVKFCTFSIPEWLGIDLEIMDFINRGERSA